jgi:arylsulfatase A-like enzyme
LRAILAAALPRAMGRAQAAAQAAAEAPRHNLLWLVSEDNNPFLGCYGDPVARTPHIDALARRGVRYAHAFSVAPVCAPSRFAILTGVHPESCAPANQMRAGAVLPPAIRTYPEYLREAGYYCTNNAKTDHNCAVDPHRIFDESSRTAHYRNRPAGAPFLAVFNHERCHESALYQPRTPDGRVKPADVRLPAYLPDTPDIRADRAQYYNAIEAMDGQIGARLAELEAAGLAADTIVFYYADNGGALPRSKRYCYADGLRCPLIVAFPPKWAHLAPAPPGTTIDTPVSLVDLAPTLLSLAGVAVPSPMQGAAFAGPRAAPARRWAFAMRNRMDERYDFARAVTDGRYHYIRNYTPHRVFQHGAYQWQAKGYQSWEREWRAGRLNAVQSRFFAGPRPFEELYDLRSDPDQVTSLAGRADQRERLETMRRALDDHMIAITDNGFIPEGMPQEGYLASRDAAAYPLPRLMALAAKAAARDRRHVEELRRGIADRHPLVRHWAAMGLLMLGPAAGPARDALAAMMRADTVAQNVVVAAEAVARLGPSAEAVATLAGIVDGGSPWPVKLQALNALTFLGEAAAAALPVVRRAASGDQEYLRNAGRYLEAVLEGRYDPAYQVFSPPPQASR